MSPSKYAYYIMIAGLVMPGTSFAKDEVDRYVVWDGEHSQYCFCRSDIPSNNNTGPYTETNQGSGAISFQNDMVDDYCLGKVIFCSWHAFNGFNGVQRAAEAYDKSCSTDVNTVDPFQSCNLRDDISADAAFCVESHSSWATDPCRFCAGDNYVTAGQTGTWSSTNDGTHRVTRTSSSRYEVGVETHGGVSMTACILRSASIETGCASGYYKSGGSGVNITCAECPTRHISATSCREGNTDTTFDCARGFVKNNLKTQCGCAAGTYYTGSTCKACPDHATCSNEVGHMENFTCNKNYTKNKAGDGCILTVCDPGLYMKDGSCQPCEEGYYKEQRSGGLCTRCPKYEDVDINGNDVYGKTNIDKTNNVGAKYIEDCYVPTEDMNHNPIWYKDRVNGGVYSIDVSTYCYAAAQGS